MNCESIERRRPERRGRGVLPGAWMSMLLVVYLPGVGRCAQAQVPVEDARLAAVLRRGADEYAALHTVLPSFECRETFTSEELRKGKLKERVAVVSELTVRRTAETPGAEGRLEESFHAIEVDGRPFSSGTFHMPVYVEGGFKGGLDIFAAERQGCYRYALSGDGRRIDFSAVAAAIRPVSCKEESGMTGFAEVDASGEITHVERTIPIRVAAKGRLTPYAAIDLVPVELNGRTYRLSSRLVAETVEGGRTAHFDARYTGCRLFKVTSTIEPAVGVVE